MKFKTDTKEKFTVITPEAGAISAIMADELATALLPYTQKDIRHIVLNLEGATELDEGAAEMMASLQQSFYEQNSSFVICCLQPGVEETLENLELLELLNVTPTESEAWDIVQMEEIERELLGD